MYGNGSMREIKRITTYEEAKLRYEQVKPIRGRAVMWRSSWVGGPRLEPGHS